ncbi:hypothetical protein [Kineococcus xinjiangensis]|uniref:hypothetical protein n=1 Tax=Kineococcus xinjiangensis TaxID=512762 RepID=UPI0011B07A54|nr:hypothetical protein [Kineococcus xinjiangensis]
MRDFMRLSLEEAEAYRESYLAERPQLVERLRRRIARTGGPELDGTVEGLEALGVWFFEQLDADAEDGLAGSPSWWQPGAENGSGFFGEKLLSLRQVRLVDEVGAYLGQVLHAVLPQARWVVYRRDPKIRDVNQHATVLEGPFGIFKPESFVYGEALGVVMYREPVNPQALHEVVTFLIDESPTPEGCSDG